MTADQVQHSLQLGFPNTEAFRCANVLMIVEVPGPEMPQAPNKLSLPAEIEPPSVARVVALDNVGQREHLPSTLTIKRHGYSACRGRHR